MSERRQVFTNLLPDKVKVRVFIVLVTSSSLAVLSHLLDFYGYMLYLPFTDSLVARHRFLLTALTVAID